MIKSKPIYHGGRWRDHTGSIDLENGKVAITTRYYDGPYLFGSLEREIESAERSNNTNNKNTKVYIEEQWVVYEGRGFFDSGYFLDKLVELHSGNDIEKKISLVNKDQDNASIAVTKHKGKWFSSFTTQGSGGVGYDFDFDQVFLDSHSVIENSEARMRSSRIIKLGKPESLLVDLISQDASLLNRLTPREFEKLVACLLSDAGFSEVKLSRFTRDSGVDIFAIYCEGEESHSVVVEVKMRNNASIGLDIVDRLYGVRSRFGASKSLVVTNSQFSADAKKAYRALNDRMALVDYQRLMDILHRSGTSWRMSPSGLWSTDIVSNDKE